MFVEADPTGSAGRTKLERLGVEDNRMITQNYDLTSNIKLDKITWEYEK